MNNEDELGPEEYAKLRTGAFSQPAACAGNADIVLSKLVGCKSSLASASEASSHSLLPFPHALAFVPVQFSNCSTVRMPGVSRDGIWIRLANF